MKILFIASSRMPTERAMGVAIMKQCEAFASLGHEVTLIVPSREGSKQEDPFAYYSVKQIFSIQYVWCFELPIHSKPVYFLRQFTFLISLWVRIMRFSNDTILYGREPELLALLPSHKRVFVELHHLFGLKRFGKFFLKRCRGIVAITHGLKEDVVKRYNYPEDCILVAPSGVTIRDFADPETKEESRERLNIPKDTRIAMYIGSLEKWKGVDTFLDASAALIRHNILPVIIGGSDTQVDVFRKQYKGVLFLGQRPQSELADNQQAADVLVIPNTAKVEISARHTSPLKVFAHMASGVPIVASATDSIKEILSPSNAILVEPDNPDALADSITSIITNQKKSEILANQAKREVLIYDWDLRTNKIIDFINE